MLNQAIQRHICLLHFKNIFLSCQGRTERDSKCYSCVEKGLFSKNLVLRPCSYCLHNELRHIKLVVLSISVISEWRNQTDQGIFKEIKLSGESSRSIRGNICSDIHLRRMDRTQ